MKKNLKTINSVLYHKNEKGEVISGPHREMNGDCSDLRGDCSYLEGHCSDLRGDCSGLRGNCSNLGGDCSGLRGDCSNLSGDLDSCEITNEERKNGIDIKDLVVK